MSRLRIGLPPGYRAADILAYHGRDPASVSERVTGARIEKPVRLRKGPALMTLELGDGMAEADFDRTLHPGEAAEAENIARRMLGLALDPADFERLPAAARLVSARPGLRIPLTATVFEAVCWAVIGQQINLTFAAALRRSMIARVGTPHAEGGLHLHPTPAEVAALDPADLTAERFSRSKARYLVEVSAALAAGAPSLDALAGLDAAEAEAALTALTGIGPWTARYILLRGFGFADIAPVGDSGLAAGLQRLLALDARPDIAAQEAAMQAFRPHRSLATVHLWAGLKDQPGAQSRKPVTAGPGTQPKRRRSP